MWQIYLPQDRCSFYMQISSTVASNWAKKNVAEMTVSFISVLVLLAQ